MFARALALLFLGWAIGFLWFVLTLPGPAGDATRSDAVIVPTGGAGRIARGLEVLNAGLADKLLVSGVDPEVKTGEFAAEFAVTPEQMACCVTLGFSAVDTRTNASETAKWVAQNDIASLRLVTSDWHMRRAAGELDRALPPHVQVIRDAVPTEGNFPLLLLEYNKFLASRAAGLAGY
ncbi:MAG: YdcF family protein [Erythrobacter sp.]